MRCLKLKIPVISICFMFFLIYQTSSAMTKAINFKEPADVIKVMKEKGIDAIQFPLPKEYSWSSPEERLLNYAVETNEIEIVRMLFAKGAIVDAKNQCREAVRLAGKLAREEVLKILIASGAVIGDDTLLTAVTTDHNGEHREIIKIMIEGGANINARDYNSYDTLLMKVTRRGWIDIVDMILDKNVEVNAINNSKETAMAYIGGDEATAIKILEMLFSHGANPNVNNSRSPLYMASLYPGYYEVGKMLLDHGVTVDAQDDNGVTPLMVAALTGKPKTVKLFIDRGANIHLKDKQNTTVLAYASISGNLEIINMLLDNGADVNEASNRGDTPLIIASCYDRPEIVTLFLDHGAKIDQTNIDGKTALMNAAEFGGSRTLKVLLARGAKKNFKDWTEQASLDIARQKGHKDRVELLESYLQKEPEDLSAEVSSTNKFVAVSMEKNSIMRAILNAQHDIATLIATGRVEYAASSEKIAQLVYTRGHAIMVILTNDSAELLSFLRSIVAGNYEDELKDRAKKLALIVYRSEVARLSLEDKEQLNDIIFYLIRKNTQSNKEEKQEL